MQKVILILALTISSIYCGADQDLVKGLDDVTGYTKPWYSGFLQVASDYNIHYLFYPSQNSKSDPVLLWLNGGPCCSSLLGASQEHGAWVFKPNSTEIEVNPYAWNTHANVIYFESPPGVGFSVDNAPSWDDNTTAQVNLQGVLSFLEKFPEYESNDFYIAGESYAGIYVPLTSYAIHNHNKDGKKKINFKGLAVGNGCCYNGNENFAYEKQSEGMGIVPEDLTEEIIKDCTASPYGDKCQNENSLANSLSEGVNVYDLQGYCFHQDGYEQQHYARFMGDKLKEVPPCLDGIGPVTFFNNDTVKELLHVDKSTSWSMCNDCGYTSLEQGSFYAYQPLIEAGYRIAIYNGITDGSVPYTTNAFWISMLEQQGVLTRKGNVRSWFTTSDQQNAGTVQEYNQAFEFVKFRGVGHMVPQYNRNGAHEFINYFLSNQALPTGQKSVIA